MGLDTASSEPMEPLSQIQAKQIHSNINDQGCGSQGERVNAWLRRRKNCKRGVRHADSIIESLPSDAWNTVPASSLLHFDVRKSRMMLGLKIYMMIHKWNIDLISVPNSHVCSSDFISATIFSIIRCQ
ncbi:hypothetical protein Tco_0679703 [Tanacetum coccineum]|uniref:Uncharacterized protein n=1 Tax=Tanacetum coccineum TaxID=301880 RepID=A0ABQ4XIK5_9ASTR